MKGSRGWRSGARAAGRAAGGVPWCSLASSPNGIWSAYRVEAACDAACSAAVGAHQSDSGEANEKSLWSGPRCAEAWRTIRRACSTTVFDVKSLSCGARGARWSSGDGVNVDVFKCTKDIGTSRKDPRHQRHVADRAPRPALPRLTGDEKLSNGDRCNASSRAGLPNWAIFVRCAISLALGPEKSLRKGGRKGSACGLPCGRRCVARVALKAVGRSAWTGGGAATCEHLARCVRRASYLSGAEYERLVLRVLSEIESGFAADADASLEASVHALPSMLRPLKPQSVSVVLNLALDLAIERSIVRVPGGVSAALLHLG